MSVTRYEIEHQPRRLRARPWRMVCAYDGMPWPCIGQRALCKAGCCDHDSDTFLELVDALGPFAPAWARRMR
ncbi:hypothetical protein [Actinoplanes missouriensis]|nr:hypothetical protein [Actinoplanes missouriensis]